MADLKINALPATPNALAPADVVMLGQTGGAATAGVAYESTLAALKAFMNTNGVVAPLASSFTLTKDAGVTATITDQTTSPVHNGVLLDVLGAAADRFALAERTVPGATWQMDARICYTGTIGRFRAYGLSVRDSANKVHSFVFSVVSASAQTPFGAFRWSSLTAFNSSIIQAGTYVTHGRSVWIRLICDSTNFTFYVSYDKVNYQQVYQVAKTAYLGTIAAAGVMLVSNATDAPLLAHEQLIIEEFTLV